MSPRIIPAEAVADLIQDGQTVGTDGFTLMGVADEIYAAIQRSYLETSSPSGLTLFHISGQSNREIGMERWAEPGLLRRIVGSHWGLAPRMGTLINDDGVEGVCLPQGQASNLLHAIAAGRPGNLTRVGLGTFVDPDHEGARVNASAQQALDPSAYVEKVSLSGEEHLLYKTFPVDVAIFRGTRMDRHGNISQSGEAAGLDALALAQAARNSGGIVICQVREVVEDGEILPRDVTVPAALVDYVVVTSDAAAFHRQSDSVVDDAGLISGVISDAALTELLGSRQGAPAGRARGRRGADLVEPGDIINVGTGIPGDTIGVALAEKGLLSEVTMSIESGVYGGVPMGGTDFGAAQHPSAIISHSAQFDFYTGGGVDIAFMGVGQVNAAGDVNVSKLGGRLIGCGGFIDILSGAKRVCFLMSGAGRHPKFVDEIDHLTFNGREALNNGQKVYLATEDYTLELTTDGWTVLNCEDSDEARERLAIVPLAA
jgi:propionate CoA-transferase